MFFPVWEDYDESEDGRGESQDPGAQSLKGPYFHGRMLRWLDPSGRDGGRRAHDFRNRREGEARCWCGG